MQISEKGQAILDFLQKENYYEIFSAAELTEKIKDFKVSAATLNSMEKKGILEKFDTTPKTYQLKENFEMSSTTSSKSKSSGRDPINDLFNLLNTVESDIQNITHWMNNETYATKPGTQIGIYKIINKEAKEILYIGKTERPFNERWSEHKDLLLQGKHHSEKLQQYFDLINKDLSKISFEILQELPQDSKIIDLRERFWIQKYSNTILNHMKPKLKTGGLNG